MTDNIIELGPRLEKSEAAKSAKDSLIELVESILETVKSGQTIGVLMVGISEDGKAMSAMHIPTFADSSDTAVAIGLLTGTIDRMKHRIYSEYMDED